MGFLEGGVDMNSSDGDSSFNYPSGNKNSGSGEDIQFYDKIPKNPQFRGSTVCWERFLPLRSLKVLLVENDDSTRHLVRALLQNCSYEVTAVSNGIQAWNILEDSSNHFDIVLTEVVVPLLTGVGLLNKIMNHNTLNNIPVIMMSSHDSMGVVFKCLSKGAVDFLVKPIRKNELKNLWQHVWRKCHSSSGSGSETGTQIKSPEGTKSADCLENNTGSNDEHENGITEPGIRHTSENGSGTQNSCTRKSTGTKSPDSESPRNQLSDALDITYSPFFQTKPGIMNSSGASANDTKKYHEMDGEYVDLSMGKDLEIQMPMRSETPREHHREDNLQRNNEHEFPNLQKHNCTEITILNTSQNTETMNTKYREMISVDLNIQGHNGVVDVATSIHDEQNVLRHSNCSAFSKYISEASPLNQVPNGNISSCFLANSPTMLTFLSHSESTPRFYSKGHGDENDEKLAASCASQNSNDKSVPLSTSVYFDQNFQTTHYNDTHQSENPISGRTDDFRINTMQSDPMSSGLHVQVQHHHRQYRHHVGNMQLHQRGKCHDFEDPPFRNMKYGTLQSGSSHVFSGPAQSSATNYSSNGSASGGNCGSNDHCSRGPNSGNNALNTEMPNLEIDNMVTGNSYCEILDETGGNDCSLRQRESVLTMFFQNEKASDKEDHKNRNGSSTRNMESNPLQNETSNVIGIQFEINSAKCNINRSISETSHGNNQHSISSTKLNLGIQQMENENMISGNSRGSLNGKNNGNGVECDRSVQREAALTKFRQKRKERCFEKKVRYQSRKKLADLRPRIRGQFVRQIRMAEDGGECSSGVFGDLTHKMR